MEKGKRMMKSTNNKKKNRFSNEKNKNRMSKKSNKKVNKKIVIAAGIVLTFIIIFLISKIFITDKNKKTNLIINNKNITANLKNDILIEDDIIYLSKSDISNFFDKYIYEEKENGKIITTYEKKIAAIGFNDNVININGSDKKIYAHAINRDGIVYLPISEMQDVYDVEIHNIQNKNVITMDSLDRAQKKAIVKSSTSVKSSTKFLAKTVDKIKKGQTVIVVSEDNNKIKIRTQNGKIGYIKNNKIENEFTVREAMDENKQIDGKVNLVWDYYSEYGSAPDRTGTSIEGVNVVSPAFFYIDEKGKLQENVGNSGEKYIKWAHNNGYKVWPIVSNAFAANKSLEITSEIMNSYEKRQAFIESIVDKCVKYDLDGINIDFENMYEKDKNVFSRFIIELTPRLKEIGLVTSVDVTAPDGGETWSMCFDRNTIGNVADYIVFMAYDQYGVASKKAGTTAGYDWVKLSLNKFLQTEEINSNKIILAIPFYTRVWTTDSSGKVTNNTVSMRNTSKVLPSDVDAKWNDDLKQYYVEFSEGNNKKQIWIEDFNSIKAKISLIRENNLAGAGFWQKDMESDGAFEMIKEELNK